MRTALVVALILVVAVIAYFAWRPGPPQPDGKQMAAPAVETAPEPVAEPAADPVASPSFDVVRISPEGNAVIAGRAEPGAEVDITEGGKVIATVTADERGDWVAIPENPIEPGRRQLALIQRTGDGETVESDSVVILAVPERGDEAAAQNTGTLALLMPKGDGGGAMLLQEPTGGIGLKGSESLSLDTIEYDNVGTFVLGGRAEPGSPIAAYMDNDYIGGAVAGGDGTWHITPSEPVTPGLHSLRIDQTDGAGKVIARLETPFSRADFLLPDETTALVIVQPGNSLWRIARRRYGLGPQYVQIFEANRDQISDPDLIYPGQIFELPQVN
ncbi:MAG: LysM peptidoglycan-binding domain-containing protein [Alphaproteobacteria bacterium]|nr:LysM peptidoglycan-binding domain-containing protein [Alphaproteobacteria bacterium]